MNDILENKLQSIHRCIERAREEYSLAGENFRTDFSHQDAAILNITRACETAIDLANHVIKREKLGFPTTSAESFELLARKGVISLALEGKLKSMVGFRNTAIHEYRKVDIGIVEAIIQTGLNDLIAFTDILMKRQRGATPEITTS